jgi:cytochrome c-type biogenesis protein
MPSHTNFPTVNKPQEILKMSLLPGNPNPYLEALIFGLSYGLLFCTSTCLPYIASYIAGIGAGFRKGVVVTVIFNSGRVIAYALIGAAVGAFKLLLSDETLALFQTYSSFVFAAVTVAIGASLLLKSKQSSVPCKDCSGNNHREQGLMRVNEKFDFRAFSLGLSRGLVICPPLLLLLVTYSVAGAAPLDSVAIALLFGIGTTLSPILLLGGVTGWLLTKAPLFRKWIAIVGGLLLIIFGFSTLLTALLAS